MVKIRRGLLGELDGLHQRMERVMEQVLHRAHTGTGAGSDWCPSADVYETGDTVVLVLDLAGVDPASLDITLECTVLRVRGRRPGPRGAEGAVALHQMEIEYGAFERLFTVPDGLQGEEARARLDNGFLEILIPKEAPRARRRVEIEPS